MRPSSSKPNVGSPSASPLAADTFDDDEVLQSILAQIEQEEQANARGTSSPSSAPATSTRTAPPTSTPPPRSQARPKPLEHAATLRSATQAAEADEETRLQALVELTAGTPLFKKPTAGASTAATDASSPRAASKDPQTRGSSVQSASAFAASSAPTAPNASVGPTVSASWSLREEEKVLESILDAIHCQQSSVSGDLADDPRSQRVEDVLQRAELVASSNVLAKELTIGTRSAANNGKGDHVLHFHEHIALRTQLEKMASSVGRPTCSCLVPVCAGQGDDHVAAASTTAESASPLYAAIGTSLSVVVLLTERWESLGVLGSVDPDTVRARSAVVSLALSEDGQMCASGHAKGTFILWSVPQRTAIRVLADEFTAPILSIRALHAEQGRFLALDASGFLRFLRPSRVMGTTMIRTTTVVQPKTSATVLADFDVIPYPSSAYLMDTNSCVSSVTDSNGVAALFGPLNRAGTARPVSLGVTDRQLVACVFSDTVLLYTLDQSSSSSNPVGRHTHPPTSSLSNELVQFLPLEQDRPEIRLCVSWNTELELLRVRFDIAGEVPTVVPELERLAVVRHSVPIATLCAVAGCNVVYVDQDHRVTLMDATVAVEAERPALSSHLDILSFTDRLCGARYKGAMSSNRQTVLVVGRKTAFSVTVLPWYARLDALLERQQFPKALELLQSFTQEVALATVGMSSQASTRRRALSAYMTKLSVVYVKFAAAQSSPRVLAAATEELLTRCSAMDMMPIFFGPVMAALREVRKQDVGLYALEAGLCQHLVTSLPEPLIDAFYALFTNAARLAAASEGSTTAASVTQSSGTARAGAERAEAALLHLEDGLDTLLALAAEHRLGRLQVCVLSLRQGQYVKALDAALAQDSRIPATANTHLDSTAVAYVCTTLQGLSVVPEVELPLEHRAEAKRLLWESFFQPPVSQSAVASARPAVRLEALLRLDAARVMQALLISLGEVGPCNPWSWERKGGRAAGVITGLGSVARLSAIAAVLACLVGDTALSKVLLGIAPASGHGDDQGNDVVDAEAVDEEGRHFADAPFFHVYEIAQRPWPAYRLVDQYLSGVAQLLAAPDSPFAQHGIVHDVLDDTLAPSASDVASAQSLVWPRLGGCLSAHFVYLFRTAEDDQERRRVQDVLIHCMRAPVFAGVSFRSFETDFTRNHMARATAALLCEAGDYSAAIDCFLDADSGRLEPALAKDVFAMLRTEVGRLSAITAAWHVKHKDASSHRGRHTDEADTASSEVTSALSAYKRAKTHGGRLRRAVMEHVPVLVKVDATALAQFVFEYLPSNNAEVIKVLRNSSDTFLKYLDELIAKRDPVVLSDMGLQNTYIELLSAYDASKVLPYLERQGTAITYDVERALSAVRRYHVADAAIYLRERMNMIPEAMRTLFDAMEGKLRALRRATIEEVRSMYPSPAQSPTAMDGSSSGDGRPSRLPMTAPLGQEPTTPPPAPPQQRASFALSGSTSSLFERRYTLPALAPAVREADKFFDLGESLCRTHDSQSNDAGNYWFQLLDIFATPRRLLSQRLEQHTARQKQPVMAPDSRSVRTEAFAFDEMDAAFRGHESVAARDADTSDASGTLLSQGRQTSSSSMLITVPPLDGLLTDAEVCYTRTMVDMLTAYTSSLLHGMIDVLDMTTVVEKVVKDHEQERFEPFRPIILDVMTSIRFNVKAHRLAQTCAVDDVVRLGRDLYRQLNRGAVPRADTCCLCREQLADPPTSGAARAAAATSASTGVGSAALSRSVLVFGCGHAYHEACAVQWKYTTHSRHCPQCTHRRLGELAGTNDASPLSDRPAEVDGGARAAPAAPAAPPALDELMWQKRQRFLRGRLSTHSTAYYDILKASVGAATAAATPRAGDKASAAGTKRAASGGGLRLVLSPPAPPTAPTAQVRKPTVDLTSTIAEALTDADILELFGG